MGDGLSECFGEEQFLFVDEIVTQPSAKTKCLEFNGILARISTREEQELAVSLALEFSENNNLDLDSIDFWIGRFMS